jgi:Tfp pilus assembly protein PilO
MKRITQRDRALVLAAVAAASAFLLVLFIVIPMRDRAKSLAAQTAALTAKIDQAAQMYRQMPAAEEEVKKLQAKIVEVFRGSSDVTPEVIRDVSQLSNDLGVQLSSIRPSEPEKVGNGLRYPVSLRFETDFPHVVRLLYELEQGPHRLWVEGVEVSPGSRGSNLLGVIVHVATYSLKSAGKGADEKS